MSFKKQTVVITGGASGIGLAAAHLIQKNNGTPLLLDMDLKKLNEASLSFFKSISSSNGVPLFF